jgi:hypothetical protein
LYWCHFAPFFVLASQKSHFWHLENEKNNEISINNMKIHFGNIVSHVKIHLCAKYGHFITNYAIRMAIPWSFGLKPIDVYT